jgi:hypothetical protein
MMNKRSRNHRTSDHGMAHKRENVRPPAPETAPKRFCIT